MGRLQPRFSVVLRRGVRRGFQTVLRERGSKTTLGSLFCILAVTQCLAACLIGTFSATDVLRGQSQVSIQLSRSVKDDAVQQFFGALQTLPFVEHVTFVTRDQAYERERVGNPELIAFLEQYRLGNPFADAMAVRLRDASAVSSLAEFLQDPSWKDVVDPSSLSSATAQQERSFELLLFARAAQYLLAALLAFMLLALVLGLVDLVRRRALARREEILVERLSGAQELAMLVPLATEGTLLLLIDTALTGGMLVGLLAAVPGSFPSLFAGQQEPFAVALQSQLRLALPMLLGGEALLAPMLATFAAWLGMRPLLSSSRISLGSA